MGFSVATIWVEELLTIGMLLPFNVTVSGVPENPAPVIVIWVPEMIVLLMTVAGATVSSKNIKIKTEITRWIVILEAPSLEPNFGRT